MKTQAQFHLDLDPEAFWHRLYFDEGFTRAMYVDGLGCDQIEVLESVRDEAGRYHRQILAQPHLEAPKFIQRLFGDTQNYTEDGTWEPDTGVWSYRVIPSRLATKIHISGSQRAEPRAGGGTTVVCDMDVRVDVVGFGKMVEKFVQKQFEEKLLLQERFMKQWLVANPVG